MMKLFLLLVFICSVLADLKNDFSTVLPQIFEVQSKSGLGDHYDNFRSQVNGLTIVRETPSENIRKNRQLTVTQIFEIRHTLSYDGSLIYARGYALNQCVCGFNSTSNSNACSYVTASQVGTSTSYEVTFKYYNDATSCSTVSNTVVTTYSPSTLPYTGCSGKVYYLNASYGISAGDAYTLYSGQGLVTFHYGSMSACSGGTDYTDYKYSGFTSCGSFYLPCGSSMGNSTFYAISANSIGIKTYTDAKCTKQTSETQITATTNCYDGTFDDDQTTDVVQNFFTWYVSNYPVTDSTSGSITISKSNYGGLIAAVFIAFLFGMVLTAILFRCQGSGRSTGLARHEENSKL